MQPAMFISGYHHLIALGTTMKLVRSTKLTPAPGSLMGHGLLSGRHRLTSFSGYMDCVSSFIHHTNSGCVLRQRHSWFWKNHPMVSLIEVIKI
jgi:hypothetical protein